ncbi:MAG TPA: glycoside hydrolase family 6 protein [Actinocrinis sp.]|nr:glycoside hydrolase family 6 protein [Actinocrinis sp.]
MKLGPPRLFGRGRLGRATAAAASAALVATALVAISAEQASAASGCSVSYTITNQWNVGFGTNISITNLGSPITSWTLAWTFGGNQQVTQLWNGNYTQSGANVSVTSLSYNGALATNASTTLGFNGSYSGTDTVPTQFTLNGVVCNGTTTGGGPTSNPPTTTPPTTTPPPTTPPTTTPPTTTPPTNPTNPPPGTHVANPFVGSNPYLNPDYVNEVKTQAAVDSNNASELKVATYQTAIWMDHIGAITGDSTHLGLAAQLNNAVAQQGSSSTPVQVEIVIYDLPGRDCAALASNGEIPATAAGLTEYETQYINPIVSILSNPAYSKLRIVDIIEPDSLPNIVTNQSISACQTATPYYESGIEYALNKLHGVGGNIYNYMDIGHSGWLGWPSNMSPAGTLYANVVKATTAGFASIDGFISDTANTIPVQEPFLTNPQLSVGGNPVDSAQFYSYDPYFDEYDYDNAMYNTFVSDGFPSTIGMLIDTSRDGWGGPNRPTALNTTPTTPQAYVNANKIDQRPFRGDWCNVNGAGIGARPAAQPFGASSHIIAYVWVKPPGESDGDYPTSTHAHGDPHCDPNGTQTDGSGNTYPTDAIPGYDIPAGNWFGAQFQQLVADAYPVL